MTVAEFCDRHKVSPARRSLAFHKCETVQEAWDTRHPVALIAIATDWGVLDDRTLRRFAAWCARRVDHFADDPRSKRAIDVAERWVLGVAKDWELKVAYYEAELAATEGRLTNKGFYEYARAAAASAVCPTAHAGAWCAADESANHGFYWAFRCRMGRDAADEAWLSERKAQAAWLRANATPNWNSCRCKNGN